MKMRFRTKLFIALFIIGLLPVLLLGFLNYRHAYIILNKQAIEHLLRLRDDRKDRLQNYFKHLEIDLEMLGDHRMLKDILTEYLAAYNKGGLNGEEFKSIDKKDHKRCLEICEKYGFEDMLFVSNDGDVLITAQKGKDWGTNLINGIYSNTNLAECFNNAESGTSLVDFKEYPPSGRPAAFIGGTMIRREARKGFEAGDRLGVLIIRIPVNQINNILLRDDWLGKTGEAYVAGKDLLMRSDSNFLKESAILKVKTETVRYSEFIEGRSGYKDNITDYRGVPVSVAYGPAEIKGLNWFVVVKKNYNEIIQPVKKLRNQNLTVGLLVFLAVVLSNFLLVTGLRRPVRRIKEAADKIASGDFSVRLQEYPGGEIGKLTGSINRMALNLMKSSKKIENYSRSLEKKVELRTEALMKKNQYLVQSNNTQKAHSEIVMTLNSEIQIESLLINTINKIAEHTDSQLGAVYLYKEETKDLRPVSAYGIDKEPEEYTFKLGNGLPGQAALERKIILVKDVPENYFRITSGSLDGLPKNVVCIPIVFLNQLMGILELASIHDYSSRDLNFLNVVVSQLAISINNSIIYLHIQEIADELKDKNDLLTSQNEELQAQSEELQAQSEELQAQSEELAAQKKEIEEQSESVKETSRFKSEFMSNMSHELRTPLNAILGLTTLISDESAGQVNEKQKEYLEIIKRNGKNLLHLINDILDLSKIESGKIELFINKIFMEDFIKSIAGTIMPLVQKKGLSLNIDIAHNFFIYCDIDKLRQVFLNLLGNAVKFTRQGEISISAGIEEGDLHDFVIIKVRDAGIGIPPDAMEYIFKPFRQVDGSLTREYDGTGLGLSISYNLVKLMGGNIKVESEVGKGSIFSLILKQDRRSKSRPSDKEWRKKLRLTLIQESEAADKEIEHLNSNARKILIIDDDPIVIRELRIILKKENHCLKFAFSGSEGLKILSAYIPDLIFLDLCMPGIDGFEVLEEIKKRDNLKNLPVMIITATDLTEDEKRGLSKNVKGVITKGRIDKTALLALTNKLLYPMLQEAAEPIKLPAPQVSGERKKKVERRGTARILVVEDRPDNLTIIGEILKTKGYTIYEAKNGREGVEIAGKMRPDLILMDMHMPVMNGLESAKHILEIEGLKKIPIIGLTARAMKGDRERVIAAGCCDYVSKPVMPKDLLKKVEQWLR
jgi:signal transduction histidine kinase/DNA-binding response OmpR family regulator/HAMP domain-containing protein